MSLRDAPRKPSGTSAAAIFMQWVWDCLAGGKFPFIDTDTIKIDRSRRGYALNVVPRNAGSGTPPADTGFAGDFDPAKTYKKAQTVRVMLSDNITFRFWFLYGAIKDVPISVGNQGDIPQQPNAYTHKGQSFNEIFTSFESPFGNPSEPNGPGGFGDTTYWMLLAFNYLKFDPV